MLHINLDNHVILLLFLLLVQLGIFQSKSGGKEVNTKYVHSNNIVASPIGKHNY